MIPGLSGYIPVRNGNSLDYCWQLGVSSLLPVCDEVIISDAGSTDGTKEEALAWAGREKKIRVVDYQWQNPVGDPRMLPTWLNDIRRNHCRFDTQITLDADEVLCPKSYPEVKRGSQQYKCFVFRRLNFWRDAHHMVPPGKVCGDFVVRQGPTELEMVSDGFYDADLPIKVRAIHHPSLRIFHLGFLRKEAAFFAKSKVMHRALHNTYDERLARAEAEKRPWVIENTDWPEPLIYYSGDYPPGVAEWLVERGHKV